MGTLLYFAIFAGLFFLMMRFGCGAHVMGHGRGTHGGHGRDALADADQDRRRWIPPETDIDPVCRTSVRTEGAKSSVYRGAAYYFCSVEHRDQFEADPERYVRTKASAVPNPTEHHHD